MIHTTFKLFLLCLVLIPTAIRANDDDSSETATNDIDADSVEETADATNENSETNVVEVEAMEEYQDLLENSPFLSLAFKERLAKAGVGGVNKIDFVGYAMIDGSWRLCIQADASSPPVWVGVGDDIAGFTIMSFQPKKKKILLEKGGIKAERPLEMPN